MSATAWTPAPVKTVITGFISWFPEERWVSIGTAPGLMDIMENDLIPAGYRWNPLPVAKALNQDGPGDMQIFFNGIEDGEDVYLPKYFE